MSTFTLINSRRQELSFISILLPFFLFADRIIYVQMNAVWEQPVDHRIDRSAVEKYTWKRKKKTVAYRQSNLLKKLHDILDRSFLCVSFTIVWKLFPHPSTDERNSFVFGRLLSAEWHSLFWKGDILFLLISNYIDYNVLRIFIDEIYKFAQVKSIKKNKS